MSNLKCYSLTRRALYKDDWVQSWIIRQDLRDIPYISLPEIPDDNNLDIPKNIRPGVYFHVNMWWLLEDLGYFGLNGLTCLIILHSDCVPKYVMVDPDWVCKYFHITPEVNKPKEINDTIPLEHYLKFSDVLLPKVKRWIELEYERTVASYRRDLQLKLERFKNRKLYPRRRGQLLEDELSISLGENETW